MIQMIILIDLDDCCFIFCSYIFLFLLFYHHVILNLLIIKKENRLIETYFSKNYGLASTQIS